MQRPSPWKRWLPCRGYGWLVPVLPVLVLVPMVLLAMLVGGGRGAGVLAVGGTALLSAALIVTVGLHMNYGPGRISIDAVTGRRSVQRRRHSLLWIPMQWWALVLPVAGVLLAFVVGAC